MDPFHHHVITEPEPECRREVRHVMVNAKNRNQDLYPSANSYTVHLTTPIKDISRVELLHAYIPNTMFNLDEATSNVIAFSDTSTIDITDKLLLTQFSMLPGFYSSNTLKNSLNTTIATNTGITVSYRDELGKFMFTRPTTTGPFSMYSNTTQMANLLGFDNTDIKQSRNNTSIVTTSNVIPLYADNSTYDNKEWILSDRVVDMNPFESVFLDIAELRTPMNEDARSLAGGTYSGNNVTMLFGMIPMDVNSGEIKRFKKTSDYDFTIDYPYPIQSLDRLTITWRDRNGRALDFNGYNDNAFLLRFHTLRKNLCK